MKLISILLLASSICYGMKEPEKKLEALKRIDAMIERINKAINDFDPDKKNDFAAINLLEQELQGMYKDFEDADN